MYLAENKQESYIKPQNYEQTKKNKNKKKKHPYAKYNFEYNEETDTFTCPGGETLTLRGEKKSKSGTGYESKKGVYYTEKCHQCPHRDQCTKSKDGIRKLEHSKLFHKYSRQSLDNIDLRAFLSIIRKCTDLKELTPELVNRLITKIEVFDSTKDENGKKHVPIKVHFIGVGVIVIPDGKTILETYEEIRKNPPKVA